MEKKKTATKKSAPAKKKKAPAKKQAAPKKKAPAKKKAAPRKRKSPKAKVSPSAEERYLHIQEAAYYLAEKNGFEGESMHYWLEAKKQLGVE